MLLYRTSLLIVKCLYMRIVFLVDPTARERDLKEVTEMYNLPQEGVDKYLGWRNPRTVSNFFYTSKMVSSFFYDQFQDLNKSASLNCFAPNPIVTDASTRREVNLIGQSSHRKPLVINFGSCT